jgi:nitrogen-specific signal transduction histidine kinase/ActR/RegA family two-component response regulator
VYSLEDITERLIADGMLRQAQKMEAIGTLTGGIAHDFNNLLAIVIGNLDLLQDMLGSNEPARERATAALNAALRGAEVTRHLLAFSRRQPLQPRQVEINGLIADVTKLLGRSIGEQVTISFLPGDDLWPVVVDRAQLEAALINLAVNARDAMPEGGALTIQTRNTFIDEDYSASHAEVAAGQYVVIEVSDVGVGMPPDVMTRIFEPFFTTKAETKGTGLGLSMVFGFIKQSGGHISVYSEVGTGTTFRLYLPRGCEGEMPKESDDHIGEAAPADDKVVLVVDDNAAVRQVIVKQLSSLGYRTVEAGDGREALATIKRGEPFDLLFTDIVMPGGINGIELAARARECRAGLKVLFTSGFPAEIAKRGMSLAAGERLLSKPYRKQDLAREIRKVLNEA